MFVYNEELYIEEMIQSILEQTYPVKDIIIVDDQSTDNTAEIVKKLSKETDGINIRYEYNENKGKVYAYAKGLSLVRTDYFFVCAGDDYLYPNYVESLLEDIRKFRTKFVYARYVIADSCLNEIENVSRKQRYSYEEMLVNNYAGGYLFAQSDVIKHILPFPFAVPFEDWISLLKLMQVSEYAYLSIKVLFKYRRHNNSTTVQLKRSGVKERDLKLYQHILNDNSFKKNNKQMQVLKQRIRFCKLMGNDRARLKDLSILTSRALLASEKVRVLLLFLPFISGNDHIDRLFKRFKMLSA